MKRSVNVLVRVACLLALGLLAVFPQAALACGSYCGVVELGPPLCFGCVYDPWSTGGCVQTGPCSCYEIQCPAATTDGTQEAVSILGFVPAELEPAVSPAAD